MAPDRLASDFRVTRNPKNRSAIKDPPAPVLLTPGHRSSPNAVWAEFLINKAEAAAGGPRINRWLWDGLRRRLKPARPKADAATAAATVAVGRTDRPHRPELGQKKMLAICLGGVIFSGSSRQQLPMSIADSDQTGWEFRNPPNGVRLPDAGCRSSETGPSAIRVGKLLAGNRGRNRCRFGSPRLGTQDEGGE